MAFSPAEVMPTPRENFIPGHQGPITVIDDDATGPDDFNILASHALQFIGDILSQ